MPLGLTSGSTWKWVIVIVVALLLTYFMFQLVFKGASITSPIQNTPSTATPAIVEPQYTPPTVNNVQGEYQ